MEEHRIGTAHPRTCSHQWRDKAVWQQLVGNPPVAPWDMVPGKTYICLACKTEIALTADPDLRHKEGAMP